MTQAPQEPKKPQNSKKDGGLLLPILITLAGGIGVFTLILCIGIAITAKQYQETKNLPQEPAQNPIAVAPVDNAGVDSAGTTEPDNPNPEPEPVPISEPASEPDSSPAPATNPDTEKQPVVSGTAGNTGSSNNGGGNPRNFGGGNGNGNNFNTYDNADQQNTDAAWVLNTSTMKIHYPDCREVRKIAPQNYATSNKSEQALINEGYTVCRVCH